MHRGPPRTAQGPFDVRRDTSPVHRGARRTEGGRGRTPRGPTTTAEGPRPRRRGPRAVVHVTTPVSRGSRRVDDAAPRDRRGPASGDGVPIRARTGPPPNGRGQRRTPAGPRRRQEGPRRMQAGPHPTDGGPQRIHGGPIPIGKGPIAGRDVPPTIVEGFVATANGNVLAHQRKGFHGPHNQRNEPARGRSQPAQEERSRLDHVRDARRAPGTPEVAGDREQAVRDSRRMKQGS